MKTIQTGIIQKDIGSLKSNEEVHVLSLVKSAQFQSGVGYFVVSHFPPFTPICIDSSYVKINEETDNIMELSESPYPLYKGLYKGETIVCSPWSQLNQNSEVYVLSTIESFVFKKQKGYVVATKKDIHAELFPLYQGTYMYEPFVVDSEDILFEFEAFIPSIKEELNTF